MSYGPVQYFEFVFPGNDFKGEIIPALQFCSATVVAFGVLSADGQGRQKQVHFAPSTIGPAGCH